MSDESIRYPVGRLPRAAAPDAAARVALIDSIAEAPQKIRALAEGLSDAELELRYRDGGWTIRQLIHHVPDSHMNGYIRMKLAVTEDHPTIKTYEESRWAELPDGRTAAIDTSLDLLDALHRRWVAFLRALTDVQLQRTFSHPEWGAVTVDQAIAMYEWHGRHHTAHIQTALARRASV